MFGLDVVHEEHGGRLALLEHGLLIGRSRRIVIRGELKLHSVRLLG